jgi:hypothetical protein
LIASSLQVILFPVVPAKAGIQEIQQDPENLGSRFRGDDEEVVDFPLSWD